MNPLLKDREIEYYLTDSGSKMVFAADAAGDAASTAAEAAGVQMLLVGDAGPSNEQFGDVEPLGEPVERADGDDAVILYTSGTTGKPKGAQLTQANLSTNATVAAQTDRRRPTARRAPVALTNWLAGLGLGAVRAALYVDPAGVSVRADRGVHAPG